jgi:hypothetical protein
MTQKPITIEDIDVLFNGDKRGRQMFIIMTNGLTNFNYPTALADNITEEGKLYGEIRTSLGSSIEYKEVLDNFFQNMKTSINNTSKYFPMDLNPYFINISHHFYDRLNLTPPITEPVCKDGEIIRIQDIKDFIASIQAYISTKTYSDELIDGSREPETIKALDVYISNRLKKAWKEYKNKDDAKYDPVVIKSNLKYPDDVKKYTAPFTEDEFQEEKIIIFDDKFHKIKKNTGEITPFGEDNRKCKSYGFETKDEDCDQVLYQCLVNPSEDKLKQCISKISDLMTKHNTSDINLRNMNPDIVLALLHRFGFKAIKDAKGTKHIISVDSWKREILPKLNIVIDETSHGIVHTYLQKLVDYINSKPEILNGNNFTTNDFYDPATKKDKFGKNVVLPITSNKVALEGLSRFYENNKFYRGNSNSFGNFMGELYDRYDFPRPSFLQMGGSSSYELFKASMDSGNSGIKYLTKIYNALKGSLSNVEITEVDNQIKPFIKEIEKNEANIIKYFKFLDDVIKSYNLFKYAPTKVKFDGADITALENELKQKIAIYQEKEDKVARFIQALAKKELHPFSDDSVFDIK